MIAARALPASEFGAYLIAVSIVTFGSVFARFGLKQTVVRFVSESVAAHEPGRASESVRFFLVTTFFGSAFIGSFFLLGGGAWLTEHILRVPSLQSYQWMIVAWIIIISFQTIFTEIFRGLHDIRLASFLEVAATPTLIVFTLSIFWILARSITLGLVINVSVLVAGFVLFGSIIIYLNKYKLPRAPSALHWREVFVASVPMFLTNLLNQISNNLSYWVVAAFLNAEAVALFGAAWKLVNLLIVPLALVNAAIQPIMTELFVKQDYIRLQDASRGSATIAGAPTLIVLLLYVVAGPSILSHVYGDFYAQAATLLAILSVGQAVNVWAGSCMNLLIMTGQQQILATITTITTLLTAIALAVTAKHGSITGVAISMAMGVSAQNIGAWYAARKLTGIRTEATLNPSQLVSAWKRLNGSYSN